MQAAGKKGQVHLTFEDIHAFLPQILRDKVPGVGYSRDQIRHGGQTRFKMNKKDVKKCYWVICHREK